MIFNSIDFAVFLPLVFAIYWMSGKLWGSYSQNLVIVAASYIFYGWWDWRFLTLLFFSSILDFYIGTRLNKEENQKKRKLLLISSISVNIGMLMFFKYFNFFLDNLNDAFTFFGTNIHVGSLQIILPVGISFYTFQTLSYSIDVYRKKLAPSLDLISFLAFVSFFPQLVAGPIERATNLLPQFNTSKKRAFNYDNARQGLRQILWGLFKKMVIADNCALIANQIFDNAADLNGSTLILGALFFTFQIYGDFSGYSDIAIGTSKLFGFSLMKNFAFPYFSRDIAEFWRRWHISLSTWFRDYVYIPLGGSKENAIRNTFIIFLLSGFWHGANWTFIVWGLLNALYFLPLQIRGKNRVNMDVTGAGKFLPGIKEILMISVTFAMTVFAWIFFRAENLSHAFIYIKGIFSASVLQIPTLTNYYVAILTGLFIFVLLLVEWTGRRNDYALENIHVNINRPIRWSLYALTVFVIFMYSSTEQTEFIYFQF